MEKVTKADCTAAKDSKLECLHLSLRKWLIIATEGYVIQPCALCMRYTTADCKSHSNETCPLHEEGYSSGSCCEAYQNISPGNYESAAIDLCDDIMDAISDELKSIAEKAKEPEVVHKVGNWYTTATCARVQLVSLGSGNMAMINKDGYIVSGSKIKVHSWTQLTKEEWTKISSCRIGGFTLIAKK